MVITMGLPRFIGKAVSIIAIKEWGFKHLNNKCNLEGFNRINLEVPLLTSSNILSPLTFNRW